MLSEKSSKERLIDVLAKKDTSLTLTSYLKKIEEKGLEDWIGLLNPDKGSHNGYAHLRNVERIADQIVPDHIKNELNPGELFLLLSAIFLHDIGRVIPLKQYIPCINKGGIICGKEVNNPKEKEFNEIDHPPCCRPFWNHYIESQKIIHTLGLTLGLPDERLAHYCGLLAFCHGLKEPPEKDQPKFKRSDIKCDEAHRKRSNFRNTSLAPYGKMRIPLLAAILRIADETDHLWTRAVREYWDVLFEDESYDLGKAFRRHIEDIEFSHDGQCLIIHVAELAYVENENKGIEKQQNKDKKSLSIPTSFVNSITRVREDIEKVIASRWVSKILAEYGIIFNKVYIEYDGHLYKSLYLNSPPPALGEVVDGLKASLENLFDAIIRLFLGSYGYKHFSRQSFEAQMGRPLTGPEIWLTKVMGTAIDGFRILVESEGETISIDIDNNEKIIDYKKQIIG